MIESCSIIVGPANSAFGKIHDRMPFILPQDRAEQWLDRKLTDAGKAMELLQRSPDDAVAFYRVSTRRQQCAQSGSGLDRRSLGIAVARSLRYSDVGARARVRSPTLIAT